MNLHLQYVGACISSLKGHVFHIGLLTSNSWKINKQLSQFFENPPEFRYGKRKKTKSPKYPFQINVMFLHDDVQQITAMTGYSLKCHNA